MKKIGICVVLFACLFLGGWYLFQLSLIDSSYNGLPTVACQDTTKPILTSFQFSLSIFINKKKLELPVTIGHDYGNCLHDMFVNDSSGMVYVRSNEQTTFTLGQFFDEWHKKFSSQQLFTYQTGNGPAIQVLVNGKTVATFEHTVIHPNDQIEILYQ